MSETSTLLIHTQLTPDAPVQPAQPRKPRRARRERSLRDAAKRAPIKPQPPRAPRDSAQEGPAARAFKNRPRGRAAFGDRLLRNSAIACAVLLGVLALGNVNQPWAVKASEGIERALTMRIDLDDSLGELTFVRNLMPESALVFLNVSGGAAMARPVDGEVRHAWSALQPWTLFAGEGATVCAAASGTVTAVSPLSGGQFGVLVDHGEGLESVYANLSEVSVAAGDAVNRGDALGVGAREVYFELRSGGESIDPAERLGL